MNKHHPDTAYLVTLVGLWMPDDEIFKKGWRWKKPKRTEVAEDYVSNDDGMYDGMYFSLRPLEFKSNSLIQKITLRPFEFNSRFVDLPPLNDNEIRKSNRLRMPKE